MTPDFHKQYRPLTSRPFLRGYAYSEYAPSGCLAPYIACFWEAGEVKEGAGERKVLVIPDTCADIIIHINYTRQTVSSRICGVADSPAVSVQKPSGDRETTFAVRFYFWAVRLFLNVKMSELYNQVLNLELVDKEAAGEFKAFLDITETSGRIAWLERFLLNRLLQATVKRQCNFNVYNAVDRILKNSGSISVKEVCQHQPEADGTAFYAGHRPFYQAYGRPGTLPECVARRGQAGRIEYTGYGLPLWLCGPVPSVK